MSIPGPLKNVTGGLDEKKPGGNTGIKLTRDAPEYVFLRVRRKVSSNRENQNQQTISLFTLASSGAKKKDKKITSFHLFFFSGGMQ